MKVSNLGIRILFTFFILVVTKQTFAQIDYFGSKAKARPEPRFKYTPYLYVDFIRSAGLGFQYQPHPMISLDLSAFMVLPRPGTNSIQEDFWKYKGYGFSINPKFHFPRKGLTYVGLYSSIQKLEHDLISVNQSYYYPSFNTDNFSCKGIAVSANLVFGFKVPMKRTSFEFYLMLGRMQFRESELTYYGKSNFYNYPTPYTTTNNKKYTDIRLAIKFGLGLGKNKKLAEIDKKFDEDYLPRYNELTNYYSSLNEKSNLDPKTVNKRKRKLKSANTFTLLNYRRNYFKLSRFYASMDSYLRELESTIEIKKNLPNRQLVTNKITYFGSNAKVKALPRFKYEPYVFIDFIKNLGIGLQHQINPYFSLDASVFATYPNLVLSPGFKDYNLYQGFGFSLSEKYHFSETGSTYVGIYTGLEFLQHGKTTIRVSTPYQGYVETFSTKGIALTIDAVAGKKIQLKRNSLEIYIMLGAMNFLHSENIYYSSTNDPENTSYPYTNTTNKHYLDFRLGLKYCFGIKKNKNNALLDKKFDDDYIPRFEASKNFVNKLDTASYLDIKLIMKTKDKLNTTNRTLMLIYKKNYYKPDKMIEKMDAHMRKLEELVEEIKKLPILNSTGS